MYTNLLYCRSRILGPSDTKTGCVCVCVCAVCFRSMAGDRCQNSHPLSRRGLCNVTNYDIRQVQPPFHTVGNYYLSVIEGSAIDRCYQHRLVEPFHLTRSKWTR